MANSLLFGAGYPTEANPALTAGAAVLDFLDGMGLDKMSIIGHSMGGGVASRLAAGHPERVDRLVGIGGVGIALFSATAPKGIKLLVEFVESVSYLMQIKAPTLITWGRDDRVTPLDAALLPLRLIPKCELRTFYDCGHWTMIKRKEEFESAVVAFLRGG